MTVTGTTVATYEVNDLLDKAFRRCRVPVAKVTSEMQHNALKALGMLMLALPNKGTLLWTQDVIIVPLYEGRADYGLPSDTVDILSSTNFRTLTRQDGVNQQSSAGAAIDAFDDDFETICVAGSPGWIATQYDTPVRITSVGLLGGTTATIDLVFERSDDGIAWTAVKSVSAAGMVDREWLWYDIDGNVDATWFRVRTTTGALSVRELFFGNNPMEIPFGRNNRDDWVNFPNKQQTGQPVNFWFDRQRDVQVLHTWPVCDRAHRYDQIIVWRERELFDVGSPTNTVDFPRRWYEAVMGMLAWRVYLELPEEVQPDASYAMGVLKMLSDEAERWVQDEERDNSPTRWAPNLRYYT